jgi:hypothetical protein
VSPVAEAQQSHTSRNVLLKVTSAPRSTVTGGRRSVIRSNYSPRTGVTRDQKASSYAEDLPLSSRCRAPTRTSSNPQLPGSVLVETQHLRLARSRCDRCPPVHRGARGTTGEALSFTGYVAFCLAHAVDEDKLVQAYVKGRKHMVIFDDVDVFLPVEREVGKTPVALPHIIRRANNKSFLEIHREIREFQTGPVPQGSACPRPSSA